MTSSVLLYNFSLLVFNYLMLTTFFPITVIPANFSMYLFSPTIIIGFNLALLLYNITLLYALSFFIFQSFYSVETISLIRFCLLIYNLLLVLFNCVLLVYQNLIFIQTSLQYQVFINNFKFN